MKRDMKDFEKYVRSIRHTMTKRNNDRDVVYLSEYSKKGKEIIESGTMWEGNTLYQVYDRWSEEKQKAFDKAWEMYCNAMNSSSFGICRHNSHMFTVSWLDDLGLTYLTASTEYHVIFNE